MKDVEIIKARNVLSSRARTNLAKRLRVAAYCRVSTDSEDQLNSYKSQVQHYTDLIKSKSEWDLAGIYADEAITGTQVTKREDFQRLINDCMNGDVDMIITKSISRFARNTLDTLKYVRMLKEKGIAVFFEEENINTLTMDGELLLVILSSVAQQEVENISANVKKGLKMKMQRGELVGFQGCLGYDYHPEDKSISVNEEEAEIVRYIFRRYIEGAGGSVIAKELENLGYKTKRGSTRWAETTVIGIIKNEKYKGDILMGKTFTLDPISKRRLDNFGEEDQFYIRDHHEAIISDEMFEKAQEILKRRAKPRRLGTDGKREKFSRKYAFSCMLECGFCGGTLTRRSWHSGSQYNKVIWQCVTATKKGKKFCPDSKGIAEETIEQAFIESYRLLCQNNKDVLDEFIARTEETLSDSNASKQLAKVEKDIAALDAKRAKLVDMRLEEIIDKDTYEQKYFDLSSQIEQLQKQRESLQESAETESTMKKRIAEFRRTLEENEVLDTFDRYVFESIVEKVIVGGYDEDGNKDPSMLTFIYKTGFKNSLDGTNFKPPRKNSKAAKQSAGLCSHTTDEAKSMYSYHSDDIIGIVAPRHKHLVTHGGSGVGHPQALFLGGNDDVRQVVQPAVKVDAVAIGAHIKPLQDAPGPGGIDGVALAGRGVFDGQVGDVQPRALGPSEKQHRVNGTAAVDVVICRNRIGCLSGLAQHRLAHLLPPKRQAHAVSVPAFGAAAHRGGAGFNLGVQGACDNVCPGREVNGAPPGGHGVVDCRLNGRRIIRAAVALGPEVLDVQDIPGFFLPAGRASVRPDGIHRNLVACGQPRQPHCIGNGGGRHTGV